MMLFDREITEPMDLGAGYLKQNSEARTPPLHVIKPRERLDLSHGIARGLWNSLWKELKPSVTRTSAWCSTRTLTQPCERNQKALLSQARNLTLKLGLGSCVSVLSECVLFVC